MTRRPEYGGNVWVAEAEKAGYEDTLQRGGHARHNLKDNTIIIIIITPIIVIITHLVWVLEGRSFERPHWEEEEVDPKDWDQDHHLNMFLIILFLAASFCTLFG